MTGLRVIITLAMLLPSARIMAQDGPPSARIETQADLSEKACHDAARSDAELEQLFDALTKLHEKDPASLARLQRLQATWRAHRAAYFEFLYPNDAPVGYFGSVLPMCVCVTSRRFIDTTLAEMKLLSEPPGRGEVCIGYAP